MTRRSSFAWRLTAALVASTLVAAAGLLAGITWFAVERPLHQVRAQVAREAAVLYQIYRQEGPAALRTAILARRAQPSPSKAFDVLLDRDGRLLFGNLPSWPRTRAAAWVTIEADLYRDGDEDDYEALSRDLLLPDGSRLLVGRDVEVLSDRRELMREAAQWGLLSVLLFAIAAGLAMHRLIARRLDPVAGTARAVMDGNLAVRVPLSRRRDEFDALGATLNAMLDRNQALLASVSRVSDSIAHELRTPLARLQGALDAGRTEHAHAEAIRLRQTFDALLRIARLDTGRHRIAHAPVQLDKVICDAAEFYEPEAEKRRQKLSIAIVPYIVIGDRDLLFQAAANLIDNAIKFAPEGGQVAIELSATSTGCALSVTDNGPGAPTEIRSRLTERFYRSPGADQVAGTGLGLSLVEAIASSHGGSLRFEGDAGRFTVRFDLPKEARGS